MTPPQGDAAFVAPAEPAVDLTECDREPIHLLGAVQPHGVLLAVDPSDGRCRAASDNLMSMFGTPAARALGMPLAGLLSPDQAARLLSPSVPQEPTGLLTVSLEVPGAGELDVSIHHSDGVRILEFEPADRDAPFGFPPYYGDLRRALARLHLARDVLESAQVVVEEVRKVTGYDRVMVYRFGADGAGEVIAEDRRPDWEPYLGLHYPASDIPVQARALYERNWTRAIAAVDYRPAELLMDPSLAAGLGRPLDLSGSVLRSVSPVHLQYLRNMGVGSSMSVSILRHGRLWGLIACHHGTRLWPPAEFRTACELLGVSISMQLTGLEQQDQAQRREHSARVQLQLLDLIAADDDVAHRLTGHQPNLLDLIAADGASVRIADQHGTVGRVPPPELLESILDALPSSAPGTAVHADRLGDLDGSLAAVAEDTAGALAVRLGTGPRDHVMWFRGEVLRTVRWAGDPGKPVQVDPSGVARLTPRASFALWQETVRGHCLPWRDADLDAAQTLWRAVTQLVLRRAAETQELNRELTRSNRELDSFAYIASHDLKEPLRGIATYAGFVLEDDEGLDPESVRRLDAVLRLVERMDALLASLLHFSQVGRAKLELTPLALDQVVDDVLDVLGAQLADNAVTVRRAGPLPTVAGDAVRLHEVFQNLLSNAIKYRGPTDPWVEIGVDATRPPGAGASVDAVFVRDNGIGVPADRHEEIFRIFRRLHPQDGYGGGAGVGLTIARKIVERHGGQLWVESGGGVGSTFWFWLPAGDDGSRAPAERSPAGGAPQTSG